MAFFFPCGWFLSRKMYKNGLIAGALEIVATLLTIPFRNTLYNLGISGSVYSAQLVEKIAQNMDKISPSVVYVAFIGAIISLVASLVSALLGDWFYKKHTVNTIKEIESASEDKGFDYRKKGGVNIFMFFLGYMAISYIPAIIATFI